MLHDGPAPQLLTKRSLVTVSHAIERSALATAEDGPLVVIALFQRMPYFLRERDRYRRIAAGAAVTVVGLVGETPPELPPGGYAVALAETEELAQEWSVVALTPRFGASLVARDRREVAVAGTLEEGRLFSGRWGFRRDEALHEVIRLRAQLGDRLPPTALTAIDQVLRRVRDLPATPGESRAEAALRLMAGRVDRAHHGGPGRGGEPEEGAPGLVDEPTLRHWAGTDGVTAAGTLPVALIGVRVGEPAGAPERFGRRSAAREAQAVIAALTAPLRPVDRAVRLAPDEYLLILPSLNRQEALAVASRVHTSVAGLARSYPFVSFAVHTAVTVTDRRPLPVADVRHAVDWAAREGVPVATVAREAVASAAH
ncbi:DICT sensory domain-containing protein [Micromonospora sp. WMMD987]|uniref:DICT sensory domain-containing protein n=1 Tax=Micromonospora sp. WMMD987 TaxID=3016089 RepID=UPI00249BAF94|nr:DICT sensory domain-containing protein [Micromonospora sp. WMMD987]WFE97975.1 DICT sensory domain-containing protein [Micromonospora sp. WMMD987]